MDVRLLANAVWRQRSIALAGLAVAALLAGLSMVHFTSRGLGFRQQPQWAATSKLLVTNSGFPEGRVVGVDSVGDFGTPRFTALAYLYASFIDSDPVTRLVLAQGPKIKGKVSAATVTAAGAAQQLPIVGITGTAGTKQDSITLTRRATTALLTYIERQQKQAQIAPKNRVVVKSIQSPAKAKMVHGRPLTLPIIVFLAVLALTLGLVSVLDNLDRPRRAPDVRPPSVDERPPSPASMRTPSPPAHIDLPFPKLPFPAKPAKGDGASERPLPGDVSVRSSKPDKHDGVSEHPRPEDVSDSRTKPGKGSGASARRVRRSDDVSIPPSQRSRREQ